MNREYVRQSARIVRRVRIDKVHHDLKDTRNRSPKDSQVLKKFEVSLMTFTDRKHNRTTREQIRRLVRIVSLLGTG